MSNPSLSQNLSKPSGANIDGINPTPDIVTANPSAKNNPINDGLPIDQKTPTTNENKYKIRQEKIMTRKKSVRRFEVAEDYWQSKSTRKVKTVSNPSAENKPVNDGFVKDQETAPTNESENKTRQQKTSNDELNPSTELYRTPIDKIPNQAPGENIISYMARFGLTLPISPGNFTTSLYSHWSDKDKKAFLFVNEKMCEAFKMLFDANQQRLRPSYLQRVCRRLHEITDGLYFFFTPVDYPFSRFISLIKFKLGKLIEATKNTTAFDFELPQILINQMVLVCMQAKNGGE